MPQAGQLAGRAVEHDLRRDEDEALDDVLDRAELVRDVEDRDAELGAELARAGRRATPATRRRRPSSARRARAATARPASAFAMNARCCIPPESVAQRRVGAAREPDAVDRLGDALPVGAPEAAPAPGRCQPARGDDLAHGRRAPRRRVATAAAGTRCACLPRRGPAASPKSSAVPCSRPLQPEHEAQRASSCRRRSGRRPRRTRPRRPSARRPRAPGRPGR